MFSIGDNVYYGGHGICIIEDIQEQAFTGEKKRYYVLHGHNGSLQLYHPVETEHSKLTPILSKDMAFKILDTFKNPPNEWHERTTERQRWYQETLETADQVQIAQMINTVMRKKLEFESIDKKLPNQDVQMLLRVTSIFYEGLAMSLGIPSGQVMKRIQEIVKENK